MPTLTNEQIQKLTDEQQETLAEMELRLARKRQKLLQMARGYPGYWLIPCAFGLVAGLSLFFARNTQPYMAVTIATLFALIQFHAVWINRRLDALMELLDADIKRAPQPGKSSDDKVA